MNIHSFWADTPINAVPKIATTNTPEELSKGGRPEPRGPWVVIQGTFPQWEHHGKMVM